MKKIIAALVVIALAVSAIAICASAAAGDPVGVAGIEFASTQKDVCEAVPMGGGDLNVLIDDDTLDGATTFGTKGIVLFKNTHCTVEGEHPEFTLTLELDKTATVNGAAVTFYEEYNSMVGVSKDGVVTIEYSTDGENFSLINDFGTGAEAAAGEVKSETFEIAFDEAVDARYIRFTFTFGDSPFTTDNKIIWEWIGITELSVNAVEPSDGGDVIIDTSSEEPVTEEPASEKPAEPTSDSGIIALAVIAALAVAGAVIVKKSR